MNELTCEEVLIARMAELDGELPPNPETERHLMGCDKCRGEVAAMQELDELFRSHERADVAISLWPQIEKRISPSTFGWQPFAVIAAALVVFKFVEMSVRTDPGFLFGLVPIVLAAALFMVLKENPFKVNANLAMEK